MQFPPGGGSPKSVVFACDYNVVRSPMAEGIMKSIHGRRVYVQSTGVRGGVPLDGFAVGVLQEIDIDISSHQPRTFEEMEAYGEDFSSYDMIVSFTPAAHRRALEYTRHSALETAYWPTLDPTISEGSRAQRLHAYRELRDHIFRQIEAVFGPASEE